MTMQARQAARAYANVGVRTGAMSADPHQLIVMLFDGAHAALHRSQRAIEQHDSATKASALSKAIDIIERGLRAALDRDQGGELTGRLDSLYDYMVRRLMHANLRNDSALVAEVNRLLGEISSAWKEIGTRKTAAADQGDAGA